MSTEIAKLKAKDKDLSLIAFYGGKERGRSLIIAVQNTVGNNTYSNPFELNIQEAIHLRKQLDVFLNEEYK